MATPWARLGSALTENTKWFFNVAFRGQPPRPCRSLAPPILGPPSSLLKLALIGLKPQAESFHPFGISPTPPQDKHTVRIYIKSTPLGILQPPRVCLINP